MAHHSVSLPAEGVHWEEDSLQAAYNGLCSEKCRLLSAIEGTARESHSVQKEIQYDGRVGSFASMAYGHSRVLDFLCSAQGLEVSGSSSQQQLYGLPGQGHGFLNVQHRPLSSSGESEEEMMGEEEGELYDCVRKQQWTEYWKKKYLETSKSTTRRRSVSPERGKAKPRRVSRMPSDRDGLVAKLPLPLGRGSQKVILLQLGSVLEGAPPVDLPVPYPIGFKIKRKYASFTSTTLRSGKTMYICSITEGGGPNEKHPVVLTTRFPVGIERRTSGGAAQPTANLEAIVTGSDTQEVWREFRDQFSEATQRLLDRDFANLESFFALRNQQLAKYYRTPH